MFEQLFDTIDLGIAAFDRDFRLLKWNRWLASRTGTKESEIVGAQLFDVAPSLDSTWFRAYCRTVFTFGTYAFLSQMLHRFCIPIETTGIHRQNFTYMQQNCTLSPLRREDHAIVGGVLSIQDVTELAAYERRLSELAERDGLTGAFNRYYLDRLIESESQRHRRYDRPLSVIMLDLDHFKAVNDRYGHAVGDTVLCAVAAALRERLREVDTVCRYGGEEFCVVLPETDERMSVDVAEELRGLIADLTVDTGDETVSVTASLGVSTLMASSVEAERPGARELLRHADEALYRAKRDGRNQVAHAAAPSR